MVLRPPVDFLSVGPHQVGKAALGRYLLHSVDLSDLVERVDVWGESAMNTENVV